MRKWPCNIVLFFALHLAVAAAGQVETMKDTVISIVELPAGEVDTTRFDAIENQELIQTRSVSRHALDSLLQDDDYWYANLAPQKKISEKPAEEKRSVLREKWFRDLLWIVILGSFIGVVVWYLVSSNLLLFRKKATVINTETREEIDTDDIFSIRFDAEIAKAESAGNYRFAVRLWYLWLLKELSEKELIEYRQGRTNHDYVMQLRNRTIGNDFSRLTRNFEYTWYGQFALSAEAYATLRNDFVTFKQALRR
ncbi:MAG: DUF4129 domain-containing protein [Chitinophagaceae bacterium]|nr:MAG: DUF4129 domain-containing protein [Chitinophagaceae bacterium]